MNFCPRCQTEVETIRTTESLKCAECNILLIKFKPDLIETDTIVDQNIEQSDYCIRCCNTGVIFVGREWNESEKPCPDCRTKEMKNKPYQSPLLGELRLDKKSTIIEQKQPQKNRAKIQLNCDQVSWIQNALDRLVACPHRTLTKTTKLATLLEIMKIIGADFEDNRAAGNALAELTEFNELRGI